MRASKGGIVATARMGSLRFPGKTLAQFAGKPVIAWVINRLQSLPYPLVIATSEKSEDDAIANFAKTENVPIIRGSENDVLARLHAALQNYNWKWLVRISGDSPLIDPSIAWHAIKQFEKGSPPAPPADIITNLYPVRSYAPGFSVELITAAAFTKLTSLTDSNENHYREHVTTYAYKHPESFVIEPMELPPICYTPNMSFCIDTSKDLEKLAYLASQIENPQKAHYQQWFEAYQKYCI